MIKRSMILVTAILLIELVSAASVQNSLPLSIDVQDASDNPLPGTYDFIFNITTATDCTNAFYSNSSTLSTDQNGRVSYYLENVGLNFTNQYYLCYYRDGVLIENFKLARETGRNDSHNAFLDKQGGSSGEFYHINQSIYDKLLLKIDTWLNQTQASTLYHPLWDYDFADLVNVPSFALAADVWSALSGNKTEINNNIKANWTDLESRKLNITDQRYNETGWVQGQGYLTSYTEIDPNWESNSSLVVYQGRNATFENTNSSIYYFNNLGNNPCPTTVNGSMCKNNTGVYIVG